MWMNEGKDGGERLVFSMTHCILGGYVPYLKVAGKDGGGEMPVVEHAALVWKA